MATDQQEWARHRIKAKHDEKRKDQQDPAGLKQIQQEAKAAGATLANGGRGGLDAKLVLAAFRKGKWRCAIPDCKSPKKNLTIDHIGGHPKEIFDSLKRGEEVDPKVIKAANMGHEDKVENLGCICEPHHNLLHSRERALEDGKKPKPVGPSGIADDRK